MNSIKKILFINFGGLGDEILFLPTILSIKKQFPNSEITLALEPRSKGITSLTNVIDKTLFANIKGSNKYLELAKLLMTIWQEHFDIVISSGSNKFISLFLAATFIPQRIGYNTGKLSEILLTHAVKLNKNQYAAKMYHDLIQDITDFKTDLPILNIERKNIRPNTVLIHPGVSKISIQKGMLKTITPEKWAKVVELLAKEGKHVLLAGGPDDKECIETIQRLVPQDLYENLYGKTKNLKELAELISSAEKFLCSDSAPLHIAVALGVKTFVIFGSTDDKKLIPQNENVIAIKNNCNCHLRPCLWERRQTTCEKPVCLDISPEEIVEFIKNS